MEAVKKTGQFKKSPARSSIIYIGDYGPVRLEAILCHVYITRFNKHLLPFEVLDVIGHTSVCWPSLLCLALWRLTVWFTRQCVNMINQDFSSTSSYRLNPDDYITLKCMRTQWYSTPLICLKGESCMHLPRSEVRLRPSHHRPSPWSVWEQSHSSPDRNHRYQLGERWSFQWAEHQLQSHLL